jgi:hypothetical protein
MNDRSAIAAELRRGILVEAGHRCAIHTCRHPDVDVHHIIPWEQCQEHSYDNLIALCPNCHRRASSGEIDRKSLRMYKAQIAASSGISDHQPSARQFSGRTDANVLQVRWKADRIEESDAAYPAYELELEFPQFDPEDGEIEHLNLLQRSRAVGRLLKFRTLRLYLGLPEENWQQMDTATSTLCESFEVSCFAVGLVSIRYSAFHYGAGAAHPNHYTQVANYQRTPLISLDLGDIFMPDRGFLSELSAYCIRQLAQEKGTAEPSEWIVTGAGPELKNFRNFNLTRDGLVVTFDEYQVGCYAEGAHHVFVPGNVLTPYVRPACRVRECWAG